MLGNRNMGGVAGVEALSFSLKEAICVGRTKHPVLKGLINKSEVHQCSNEWYRH